MKIAPSALSYARSLPGHHWARIEVFDGMQGRIEYRPVSREELPTATT